VREVREERRSKDMEGSIGGKEDFVMNEKLEQKPAKDKNFKDSNEPK